MAIYTLCRFGVGVSEFYSNVNCNKLTFSLRAYPETPPRCLETRTRCEPKTAQAVNGHRSLRGEPTPRRAQVCKRALREAHSCLEGGGSLVVRG